MKPGQEKVAPSPWWVALYAQRLLAMEENTSRAAYISQADIQRELAGR